jgi:hypothetical protein
MASSSSWNYLIPKRIWVILEPSDDSFYFQADDIYKIYSSYENGFLVKLQ